MFEVHSFLSIFMSFSYKSTDVALLLTTIEMQAQKELVFSVTRNLFKLELLAAELRGYGISLKITLIWQILQSHLHEDIPESGVLEFNLKLDGRPLAGMIPVEFFSWSDALVTGLPMKLILIANYYQADIALIFVYHITYHGT